MNLKNKEIKEEMMMKSRKVVNQQQVITEGFYPVILPLIIIALWAYVTQSGKVSSLLLPTIPHVVEAFKEQILSGRLIQDLSISLSRILKGYSLATLVGITLGVAMGMSSKINQFCSFTFTSLRQIPMMAWIPLFVMWFGIDEESKVAVIFMASYFPIMINTLSGIKRTDQKLIEVGKMYRLSYWKLFQKIYFPSAIPSIFVGLRLGLGISWMAVVGAEMLAASSGIGFRINDARSLMESETVFVGIISIAIVGVVMDFILSSIARVSIPWEQKI